VAKAVGLTSGNHQFKTKSAAAMHCRVMLNSYGDGGTVSKDDSAFVLALLERHPYAALKTGSGVRRFFKAAAPKPSCGNRCFWIEHTDETTVDFSFMQCLK
jgi:hypothetical protein